MQSWFKSLSVTLALLSATTTSAQTITGTVLSAGQPVKRARLYISGTTKPIFTDSNGRFSVSVAGPGVYTVTPYPNSSRQSATPFNRTVGVPEEGATNVDFDFNSLGSRSALRGRILDKAGLPQSRVEVHISGIGSVESDANGIYGVSELPAARYSVTALRSGVTFTPAVRIRNVSPGRAARIAIRATPLSAGPAVATSLSGVFHSTVQLTSGVCPILPPQVEGRAVVLQRDRSVRFYLPRLGFAVFDATVEGFRGTFRKRKLGCTIEGDINTLYSSADAAEFTGAVTVVCLGAVQCDGSFSGVLQRQ